MTFVNGKAMLENILNGADLYNREKEIYVFRYNDAGSIAYYYIDNEEAEELAKLKEESEEEYWGAFLGVGGWIIDDPECESYEEGEETNLDWCNDNYEGNWEVV